MAEQQNGLGRCVFVGGGGVDDTFSICVDDAYEDVQRWTRLDCDSDARAVDPPIGGIALSGKKGNESKHFLQEAI